MYRKKVESERYPRYCPSLYFNILFIITVYVYLFSVYFYTSGTIYLNYVIDSDCVCLVSLDFDNYNFSLLFIVHKAQQVQFVCAPYFSFSFMFISCSIPFVYLLKPFLKSIVVLIIRSTTIANPSSLATQVRVCRQALVEFVHGLDR
jgi:hypothetical protein